MPLFRENNPKGYGQAPLVPYATYRPITAAASSMSLSNKSEAEAFRMRRSGETKLWQSEAWEYYDAISEIKFAFNLVASVVSRIRLYVAVVEDPAEVPVAIRTSETVEASLRDDSERLLARLDSAYGGQAGLLRDAALNLSVTGECYLVQAPARMVKGEMIPESWDIRSVDELMIDAQDNYFITPRRELQGKTKDKEGVIPLNHQSFIGRIWRAHPRFSEEPDSSVRGVLDLCSELLLIGRMYRTLERSRLPAGLLFVPDGMSTSSGVDPEDMYDEDGNPLEQSVEEAEDEFEDQLFDALSSPIDDERSASSIVPLIIRGPADLGKEIRPIDINRPIAQDFERRADRVLERILQGIDVPKDTITGLANVKYSNAIQIDESLYKAHIEPMLLLISDAFTVIYLRPHLLSLGYSEAEVNRIVVWYDPSSVATRNDRAADADSGYEKGLINGEAWRRSHGFSDADAPTARESALRLLFDKGQIPPELFEPLLRVLDPELMEAARAAAQATSVAPVPTEVQNALNGQPGAPVSAEESTPEAPASESAPNAEAAPAAPSEEAVEPGEDAPPVPLAEPTKE